MTRSNLAEGYLEIANTNMAQAIRTVSIARGYAPEQYLLVSFGGAGSQHACSIAESLGMKTILIHPEAGILSAVRNRAGRINSSMPTRNI